MTIFVRRYVVEKGKILQLIEVIDRLISRAYHQKSEPLSSNFLNGKRAEKESFAGVAHLLKPSEPPPPPPQTQTAHSPALPPVLLVPIGSPG
ncbi:hypothetical protein PGTUg99_016017 [Puccinia graminis f. sp. tritici]|uniref:Uncharacterized protein n=1 Tax=Puccinia graminis f. sp. tritici TaxID=56615 RepID=A0A5B0RV71_PUCGR|nr:hypothetical protein PGTUg99_016017 [Puccinia graminis f. sp. tritici]